MTYVVELIQTDPQTSPTPGLRHYAGEVRGFDSATGALRAGIARLGKPVPQEDFWPCCDWQKPETIITAVTVHAVTSDGYPLGPETRAHWKGGTE